MDTRKNLWILIVFSSELASSKFGRLTFWQEYICIILELLWKLFPHIWKITVKSSLYQLFKSRVSIFGSSNVNTGNTAYSQTRLYLENPLSNSYFINIYLIMRRIKKRKKITYQLWKHTKCITNDSI